jgi:hypothetical protein
VEQLRVGRVAEERRDPASPKPLDLAPVAAHHDVLEAASLQRGSDHPADAPVAAQDRVAGEWAVRVRPQRRQLGRAALDPGDQAGTGA